MTTCALIGLIFVPFLIGLYFMWNKHRVVDGANDNLSGCYMGIAILKALQDEGIEFENTEIGVILSGSEEAGLRGARLTRANLTTCLPLFIPTILFTIRSSS